MKNFNKEDYKILIIRCCDGINANEMNTTVIMIQNFFDNCKQNNFRFKNRITSGLLCNELIKRTL